ncbi:tRNA (uridine(54)-C5)-methyltransferase TrmA [Paraglaciecola aquimarina]|uniref:tRNA/tmRNA (uracil-C(5))-methyltransferase n=1 Tax=Paraglaciecola aquimarina TaxID=1235557 RepID=A0ABU3STA0_9ALTE|nr:tRNA (uridine(54)-C5)-methyltransferase TrmA [Paraglaciecola aquimarina]MDU0353208.1 tRNA (uridine(54)-C5)-methyltransferase TrmA [Paraglaciecola aquimarina]
MRPTEIKADTYAEQLQHKTEYVGSSFESYNMPQLEVFASDPLHYRMRAEFRVWHEGDELHHVMFDQSTKQKYQVQHFPPASQLINSVMADLIAALKINETLRRKLFQIDYLATLSGEIIVSLLYHKPLDETWQLAMQALRSRLQQVYKIDIIGRAKKQKIVLDKDYVIETLSIQNRDYFFKQIENSFTQPNAKVNIKMLEWALDITKNSEGDLLELYCGSGNFSVPLAQNFDQVLATEISKTSVAAAQYNIAKNNIDNLRIIRMSSEEFVQAQQGVRTFRRLEGIDLKEYNCKTVLVDPPRAGLDDNTVDMIKAYQNIIYISCNPETLKHNLDSLLKTHRVSRFALFDQFPYTHHAECGVYLQKI